MNRRKFLAAAGGTAVGLAGISPIGRAALASTSKPEVKAIAFDGFPIFDPRPIFALTKTLFPEQGAALGKLWFAKIFGYTWLRTLGGRYQGFHTVIEDALTFSAESLKLELSQFQHEQLMTIWLKLNVWPDVKPALQYFHDQNIRLGFLSNLSEDMMRANARNADIEDAFEFYLSTDRVQAFKPSPLAYQMGVDAFALPKENIAFAAFGGWDAAGANWFGYPTVWVNRFGVRRENLGTDDVVTGRGISSLVDFIKP